MSELIGVALGGLLGLVCAFGLHWWQSRQQSRSLAKAYAGEIKGLLSLIDYRGYRDGVEKLIQNYKKGGRVPPGTTLLSDLKHNYFIVHESNAGKIGLLPRDASEHVSEFYILVKSLLEDATNPKVLAQSPERAIQTLEHDIELLGKLEEVGRQALEHLK